MLDIPIIDKSWIGFKGHLFDVWKELGAEHEHEGEEEHEEGDHTDDPPDTDPCDGITFQGVCQDAVVTWCDGGVLYEADCAKKGWGCDWVGGEVGNDCVEGCGDLDYAGACVADSLRWCEDEQVVEVDCAGADLTCGWTGSLYDCG